MIFFNHAQGVYVLTGAERDALDTRGQSLESAIG